MKNSDKSNLQIDSRTDLSIELFKRDSLQDWFEAYFGFEVTTLDSSQEVNR